MKYHYAVYRLLVILAVFMAVGNGLKAKAEYGDNFIFVLNQATNQTASDLTLEPDIQLAPTPNPTPTPEAPQQKTPSSTESSGKPSEKEEKPQECSVDNLSTKKSQEPNFGKIKVIGSTLFQKDDLLAIFEPFKEREPNPKELAEAADKITLLYLNKGYINSRAVPPIDQDGNIENSSDGTIAIQVIEGSIGKIEVFGLHRVNASYVCSRIQLGAGIPLNSSALENQLRLLRADPLFGNVEATLRAPDKEEKKGSSTLVLRVKEANPFTASLSIDNYFPPVVGSLRWGTELRYRNLTGIGDEIAGSYYRSFTGGAEVWDFIYRVPLNPMNGVLQLRAAPSRTSITEEQFDKLGVRGTQELYELTYRQPLIRSYNEEFALSFGFTYQNGQTFILNDIPVPFLQGPNPEGITRTSVIKFSQEYTKRDTQGAWSLRSQFSLGTGLFAATINQSPTPDGRFFSWLGQVQRVQRLNDDNLLLMQVDLQLTPDNLLTSQQFIIGGGQSLRGYRENLRTGDNGFRFSVEDRFTVMRDKSGYATLQVAPYLDLGAVWNNPGNPNRIVNENFLVNTGLGLLWNKALGLDGLDLRVDYSIPVLATSDRGDNIQDAALYFSVRYQPW